MWHIKLNQELYLWVIQEVKLDKYYYNGENTIHYSTKFVVEGEKLTRPELPQLNLVLDLALHIYPSLYYIYNFLLY